MFASTETNVADDATEVEDDSTAPGSGKQSGKKRDHEKETPAQKKLQTELGEINDEFASYACIRERTGLSDEYKNRVEALTSKKHWRSSCSNLSQIFQLTWFAGLICITKSVK